MYYGRENSAIFTSTEHYETHLFNSVCVCACVRAHVCVHVSVPACLYLHVCPPLHEPII